MSDSEPANLSGYDRARRSDDELIAWLASGAHQRELAMYLGEAEFRVLAPLAQIAASQPNPGARGTVLLLPGIMGTQLGIARDSPWPHDLLWVDAVDISQGRLTELRLDAGTGLRTLGGISYSYLALQLRLRVAGYAVTLCDYDWRGSLLSQGQLLAQRIRAVNTPVSIVAHSMGGLVTRAALATDASLPLKRAITLGAPHLGTLGVVQALRGTYPTVRRLAAIDQLHSAEQLAQQIFRGFPSIYEMLPATGALSAIDLFDAAAWPADQPQPDAQQLKAASGFQRQLAGADARFHCIAGIGQRTVTGLASGPEGFEYHISSDGDGTVPTACATLEGAGNYFAECEHSELPRSESIATAVVELLNDGRTSRLAREWWASTERVVRVSDAELRNTFNAKVDWRMLTADERRIYLNRLNQAPPQYSAEAGRPL